MAPPKQQQPPFSKDERVLCFHMEMLYEAKILDVMAGENGEGWQYKIHYKGWKSSWDDWVPQDRVRKFTEENKDLASQLATQFKALQSGKVAKPPKKAGGRANGSDLSSARGSEERTAGTATQSGRGPRRARDFDLETVSFYLFFLDFVHAFFCFINLIRDVQVYMDCYQLLGLWSLDTWQPSGLASIIMCPVFNLTLLVGATTWHKGLRPDLDGIKPHVVGCVKKGLCRICQVEDAPRYDLLDFNQVSLDGV